MLKNPLLPEEHEAKQLLEKLGLTVYPVPASPSKSPDFIVDNDARGYTMEVKTRIDSKEWTQTIAKGEPALQERLMSYGRWTEDVAHKALKQFSTTDPWHLSWWVLWLTNKSHLSSNDMLEATIGSLFGVRQVVYYNQNSKEFPMRYCLFARFGVFERYPEIVATVIDLGNSLSFCVNEFAPDFTCFQQSVLYSKFACSHPPISATNLTTNEGFFQLNFSVNRKDDKAIASYLEQTYRLKKAKVIDIEVHSATIPE